MTDITSAMVAVYAILLNENNEFLLVKEGTEKDFGGRYHFPGGRLGKDENDIDGLKREVKEELGVDITDIEIKFSRYVTKALNRKLSQPRIALFFLAKIKKGQEINIDKTEVSQFNWFKKSDLNKIEFWLPWYREMLEIILP